MPRHLHLVLDLVLRIGDLVPDATDLVLIAAAQTIISPRQGELVNATLTN